MAHARTMMLLLGLALLSACREDAAPHAPASAAKATTHPAATPASKPSVADGPVDVPAPVANPPDASADSDTIDALLRKDDTLSSALARLGVDHVVPQEIHLAEGEMAQGWVLYPNDASRRIDVFLDEAGKHPATLRVSGERSVWRRSDGIRLGLRANELQRMNGRPFELTGFYWDYGGTIMGFGGGKLADGEASIGFVRMCPPDDAPDDYPAGEGTVRSDTPALVAHPPYVCEFSRAL